MAQSKPRPGPWELQPVTCKSGRNKLALRASGRHICVIDISIYDDEDVANARLIAAAPELLAALSAIASLEGRSKADAVGLIKRARHIAKCAVAKAEGGAS